MKNKDKINVGRPYMSNKNGFFFIIGTYSSLETVVQSISQGKMLILWLI